MVVNILYKHGQLFCLRYTYNTFMSFKATPKQYIVGGQGNSYLH